MSTTAPRPRVVSIDPAGAEDLDDVMRIMDRSFVADFGEAWTRSQCAGILPMSGVRLSLARTGSGEARGFSLLRTVADEAELLLIGVVPDARRQGIGRALIDHFIAHASQAGATRLHLEVRDGNFAIGMYRQAGFKLAGRRRNYYRGSNGELFDALTLVRTSMEV